MGPFQLFKHVDLRKTPSLEFALMLVFSYIPYGFAEALGLSGIMSILFCGIAMSQYTQQNISPVTQITFRQTFRTISFVAGKEMFFNKERMIISRNLNFCLYWNGIFHYKIEFSTGVYRLDHCESYFTVKFEAPQVDCRNGV